MPIKAYFGGKGEKVMRQLVREHGAKKAKQIFYATANKIGASVKPKHRKD
ncbi:MAG TPA: hypothetical protein VNU44_14575 [Bryobacteraceae bacterium]|jgi:hypothetical protein|nr:hypothetical protein [Bryobacteraceae bacterium]